MGSDENDFRYTQNTTMKCIESKVHTICINICNQLPDIFILRNDDLLF